MSSRNSSRGALKSAFDVRVFLGHILDDLYEQLVSGPDKIRPYLELRDLVSEIDMVPDTLRDLYELPFCPYNKAESPRRFRLVIKRLLSDARCMDTVGYYAALRQVDACVSKLPSWGAETAARRREAAREKFLAADKACARANKRIAHYSKNPGRLSPTVRQVIFEAQDAIFRMLGPVPDDDVLFGESAFGPGLTYGLPAEYRNLIHKIHGGQTVTPRFRSTALRLLSSVFPHWAEHLSVSGQVLEMVRGNRVAFVPKTSTVDRTIGIEPSLNVFFQKGVDSYLKKRLLGLGLRLRDQEFSSDLIRKNEGLATIDLSSASDSVSQGLVKWLLPSEWFEVLDILRSPEYTMDKGQTWSTYHKFSSMGNATTFPLESMIFMALAQGCCRVVGLSNQTIGRSVRVYGDDIIVPQEVSLLLIEVLAFLGFSTNRDKTFIFGPFRETCGVDILHGVDVRPVYLRYLPARPWHVANLFNRLLTNKFGFMLERACQYLFLLVPKPLLGPAYLGWSSLTGEDWAEWYAGRNSEGDAYFFAPHAHHEPVRVRRGWNTLDAYVLQRWLVLRRPLKGDWDEQACYLAFLLGLEGGKPLNHQPVVGVSDSIHYGNFPQLDWWPRYCYPEPRRPSDRVLRQVTAAELDKL